MSQRRSAQLGLVAGGLVLVGSIVVLISGSSDLQPQSSHSSLVTASHAVTSLADSQLGSFPISIDKR
jgi:hypothetical protein